MKLFNKSRLPDAVLEPLLVAAGRAAKAKTDVVVKVTRRSRPYCSGTAHRATFVNTWHLQHVRKWKSDSVSTNGGWFHLVLPGKHSAFDSLDLAVEVFKIAIHEWVHIADYQALNRGEFREFGRRSQQSGRRGIHDRRPEELRAIDGADEALRRGAIERHQDKIIALALALDV